MTSRLVLAISLITAIASCVSVQPPRPSIPTLDHHVDRNYTIGKQQEVFVGQALVRVKDYFLATSNVRIVRPDRDFSLFIPLFFHTQVAKGAEIVIAGSTERDGKTYQLITLPDSRFTDLHFLIHDNGTFEGSALGVGGIRQGVTYTPDPADVRLLPDTASTVDRSKGYINFELVYGGTSGDSFQALYREYTPDDLARPAFSQPLVYKLGSHRVRFRDIQIDVAAADNEHIVYTVISDGLPPA